jgi:hypothetical protein
MSLGLFSIILALGGAELNRPTVYGQVAECPASTPAGRRLVHLYTSDQLYARGRTRDGLARVAPEHLQRLEDTGACARILQLLEERAQSVGGTTASSRPEIYTAGAYYYAVIPAPPSRCRPKPDSICLRGGWQPVHVFDRDFKLVTVVMM